MVRVSWLRVVEAYLVAFAAVAYPSVTLADEAARSAPTPKTAVSQGGAQLPGSVAKTANASSPRGQTPASSGLSAPGVTHHRLYLRVDGNLPGRCSVQFSSGKSVPIQAKIIVLKDAEVAAGSKAVGASRFQTVALRSKGMFQTGQVVTEMRSDESGRFQIVGLRPGSYSVVATGRETVGVSLLTVLPYETNAAKEVSFLNLTMVSAAEEGQSDKDKRETPTYTQTEGGYGGGGGGGGGMGGLGALAGLAGLGGLGGLGGGGGPASPAVP